VPKPFGAAIFLSGYAVGLAECNCLLSHCGNFGHGLSAAIDRTFVEATLAPVDAFLVAVRIFTATKSTEIAYLEARSATSKRPYTLRFLPMRHKLSAHLPRGRREYAHPSGSPSGTKRRYGNCDM
jgi:hypothetical protein